MSGPPESDATFDALQAALSDAGVGTLVCEAWKQPPLFEFVSDEAARILGTTPEALLGADGLSIVAPEELERMRSFSQDSTPGAPPPSHFETRFSRHDGKRVPVEVSLSITSSSIAHALITVSDISERERVLRELEESEKRFRLVIESAPEAIWIVDAQRMRYVNPAALALFGFASEEEVVGKDPRDFLPVEDHGTMAVRLETMLTSRRRLPPQEYRIRHRDGRIVIVEVSSIAIDYDGLGAVLSFARDVSERKRIELRLLQADRLAALGLLAGGMAHAINNPLTYVLLDIEHVERALKQPAPGGGASDQASAQLTDAYQGAERIAEVVRRMRAFSRVDERSRSFVDIRRVLNSAVQLVGHELSHRGQLVTVYDDVPPINASSAHLEQVFLHLLVHAAQSLPGDQSGEVRLEVTRSGDQHLEVRFVLVGAVMDAESLAQAFEPFFADKNRDVGMGLPFCRAVVSAMGGEIIAESDEQSGTTFRVRLPIGRSLSAPPESGEVSEEPGHRTAVLIVDADRAVGSALVAALDHAHDVVFVQSALDARDRLIGGERYDAVLCEVALADLDGPTLWEVVGRVHPRQASRFVFMVSGTGSDPTSQRALASGRPLLQKPFRLEAVLRVLEQVERRHTA